MKAKREMINWKINKPRKDKEITKKVEIKYKKKLILFSNYLIFIQNKCLAPSRGITHFYKHSSSFFFDARAVMSHQYLHLFQNFDNF